jgi:hypothetical protein
LKRASKGDQLFITRSDASYSSGEIGWNQCVRKIGAQL